MIHISETLILSHYKKVYGFYPKDLDEWWNEDDVNDYHYELSVIDSYGAVGIRDIPSKNDCMLWYDNHGEW